MPDRADRDRAIGGLAFAGSGIAFLVAVAFLYRAEGPGSPDILVTLSSPAGRGLFNGFVAAGIVAAILYAVGLTALTTTLRDSDRLASRAALVLGLLAAATLITLLAFQFALTAVAREGLVTTSSFRPLTVPFDDPPAGTATFERGEPVVPSYAIRSGENGFFTVANASALYRVMRVASASELGLMLATVALLGDDRVSPWFEGNICFYDETDNARQVLDFLSQPALAGTQLSGHNVITPLVLPPEPYGLALQARPYGGQPLRSGDQYASTITTEATAS